MRFMIMGAGSVGSAFGGFLRKAGHDVVLIGRGDHLEAIESHGLQITGIWGSHTVSGFECFEHAESASGHFDAIFVCVKSFDTARATRDVGANLSADTLLVSLQNGIGNVETMRNESEHPWVLGGRVIFGITRPDCGKIDITVYTQPVLIGYPAFTWRDAEAERTCRESQAASVATAIDAAGIPCAFTKDIEKHQWAKLLYSCALNPLGALHRVHYGALPENPEWHATMDGIIDEIFEVAAALDLSLLWSTPEEYRELFYGKLIPDTYNHRSSMLQDVEKGRRTEIDALCGTVVTYGHSLEIATPINNEMVTRIKALSE